MRRREGGRGGRERGREREGEKERGREREWIRGWRERRKGGGWEGGSIRTQVRSEKMGIRNGGED